MIICLCKNVSDREIKDLVCQGKKLCDVVRSSEAGTSCGACTEDIRKIVRGEGLTTNNRKQPPVRES